MNAAPRSFLSRVRDVLKDLPPAEKRLGDFVCDFPGELASYSASELASLAHVSNATVTRFVRRLGYESYEESRRHAREEKQTGSRLFLSSVTDQAEGQSLAAHVGQGIANLEKTFLSIRDAQIDAVIEILLTTRKTWVMGFRSSQPFASYLQWQMMQVVDNIVAVPGPGQTLAEYIAAIAPNDLVIVFALRRRVAKMDDILSVIEKRGAKLLYITDEGAPLRSSAQWHFYCQTLAPGPLFNHVAVMGLCHLLATRAIEKAGVAGRKRLRDIEAFGDVLEEL
ncbi:DNA-binding protein [Ochrobactrum sp. MYb15]|uniref:MurR/RpiR family transcriptional regulator n=1 Tax=Brucella pituitosa TaxID=571256 RepID=UPI000CFCF0C3|nr:DNA-binding protein [Ochrobactrum sp. MYb19]PRA63523.1 DNA-binding protein [Ochrobactrum sp. MYb18]PRA73587.1 DNA-binding protein [Brucella thiophenivorans]PRA86727.1 DNA-binding protein [Ochrobactrum sp. MYb14]PRA94643.1 DNA-binding protein [Ochrobactrum sp. MYb15]